MGDMKGAVLGIRTVGVTHEHYRVRRNPPLKAWKILDDGFESSR